MSTWDRDNSEILSDEEEFHAEIGLDEAGNWSGPPIDDEDE